MLQRIRGGNETDGIPLLGVNIDSMGQMVTSHDVILQYDFVNICRTLHLNLTKYLSIKLSLNPSFVNLCILLKLKCIKLGLQGNIGLQI